MNDVAAAIRAAVESQGVSWGARRRVASPEELAASLQEALAHFPDYATPRRLAAIIGESAQESDWFCTTTEYGSGHRYAPYIGRGFIQLTWRDNYARFGQWAKNVGLIQDASQFVSNPGSLASVGWAWYPACWFFAANQLGGYADAMNWNAVSGLINAGNAGYIPASAGARSSAINAALKHLNTTTKPLLQEDDMPSAKEVADEILYRPLTRRGANQTGETNLAAIIAWIDQMMDNNAEASATATLQRNFPRRGAGMTGETNLQAIVQWIDRLFNNATEQSEKVYAAVDAALKELSVIRAQGGDPEQVMKRIEEILTSLRFSITTETTQPNE